MLYFSNSVLPLSTILELHAHSHGLYVLCQRCDKVCFFSNFGGGGDLQKLQSHAVAREHAVTAFSTILCITMHVHTHIHVIL